ncbi:MAG: hypothetical protein Q8S38_16150 [Bosea sp. (in: a-proteobacteria)]|nr:hypothetical protein [Bosea sp. (in: a-proteobacteria)]
MNDESAVTDAQHDTIADSEHIIPAEDADTVGENRPRYVNRCEVRGVELGDPGVHWRGPTDPVAAVAVNAVDRHRLPGLHDLRHGLAAGHGQRDQRNTAEKRGAGLAGLAHAAPRNLCHSHFEAVSTVNPAGERPRRPRIVLERTARLSSRQRHG